ncbi:unnamed protein product [Clonostachys rhizophaga]|uniref:Aldehyde dehydrogenase domain-containing protein n=1 Tax=Clonostachys rhizophaga TaxID=160324 RepID=A0A9N9VW48_9HYPO|nr:unnamed protein product [Clonostachys rhizophaga]
MSASIYKDEAGNLVVPCLIDGKPVVQPSTRNFPVYVAVEERVLHHGQTATPELAARAIASAGQVFKTYKRTPVDERYHMLLKAADILQRKVEEGASRQSAETSATKTFSLFNAKQLPKICREIAAAMKTTLAGEITPTLTGNHQMVFKEPVGAVLLIMPWNGALALPCRGISAALAAGCTVVLKASELCPWTHYFLVETFLEAGFPPGSVNMIMSERTEAPAVTEAIISHPSLAKIEFIGSAPVGKQIGAVAAKYLKPIIMELGDQSPLIVLDDADLDKAARDAIAGCVACHGQLCFGTERIIVQRGIKDKFYELLRAALANAPPMGAAVTKFYAERAKGWVDEAVQKGAEFLAGKSEWTGPASLTPSVLINLPKDCYLYDNEAFCPTMFVVEVDTDEEAILEANSREGGLSASVYTTNWERGLNMSKSLDFGNVQINLQTNQVEATGPVTGWKASGYGSGFGRYSIEEFIHLKTVAFGPTSINQLSNSQQGYERMN